tara:strand:- start:1877 stop:3820 length:1944 start_codon:yes stop_codon:yes gene_type:complete
MSKIQLYPYTKKEKPSLLEDTARSGVSGIARGVGGLLSVPEELYNIGKLGINKIQGLLNPENKTEFKRTDIAYAPSFQQIDQFIKNSPIGYTPKTKLGEFAQTMTEYGTGGRFFGKIPGRVGAGAGAVKESTEGAFGETGSTLAGLGADIAGNLIFGFKNPQYLTNLSNTIKNLKQQGKVKEAEELVRKAKEFGIDLSMPEAVAKVSGDKTMLGSLDAIGKSEGGMSIVNNFTKDRFPQISNANRQFLNETFPDIDMSKVDTKGFTNNFVNTLIKEQQKLNQAINLRARTLKKGGWAKFDAGTDLNMAGSTYLDLLNISIKNESKANRVHFNNIAKFLRTPNGNVSQSNLQDAYQFAIKEAGNVDLDGATRLIYQKQAQNIKGILDSNEYFVRATEFTKRANEKFADTFRTLNLEQGDLTKVSNPTFTLLENTIFDPKNIDKINIKRLHNELNKIDPTLFPELAGIVVNKKINNITKGKPTDLYGGQIYEMFMGKGQKELSLEMIRGVAISQGKDPDKAVQGFKNIMEVFEATSYLPQKGSDTMLRSQTTAGLKDTLFNISLDRVPVLNYISNKIAEARGEELAKIFFSEDAINRMINLGSNKDKWIQNTRAIVENASRSSGQINNPNEQSQNGKQKYEVLQLKDIQ